MFFNKTKSLLSAKPIVYEYALSAAEVRDCLWQLFRTGNELHETYDITGGFISETEFKYNLIGFADVITFPVLGTIVPVDETHCKIILKIQSRFSVVLLLSLWGLLAIINLVLFFIKESFENIYWFTGLVILGPFLINSYVNAVSSALKLRYKKYLHQAILETYRNKHYIN